MAPGCHKTWSGTGRSSRRRRRRRGCRVARATRGRSLRWRFGCGAGGADGGWVKNQARGDGTRLEAAPGAAYRTHADVLLPLAHVGAVLQGGASVLPEVPATVGVPRLQAHPAGGGGRG